MIAALRKCLGAGIGEIYSQTSQLSESKLPKVNCPHTLKKQTNKTTTTTKPQNQTSTARQDAQHS